MLFGFFSALLENCKHKVVTRFSFLVPVISKFIFSYFSDQQWPEFKSCTCLLLCGIQGRVRSVFPWSLVYIFSLALLCVLPVPPFIEGPWLTVSGGPSACADPVPALGRILVYSLQGKSQVLFGQSSPCGHCSNLDPASLTFFDFLL